MTVKCAFGIAASKFQNLHKSVEAKVENTDHIVKAMCLLHNITIDFEKIENMNKFGLGCLQNESNCTEIPSIQGGGLNNRAHQTVITIRNSFHTLKRSKYKYQLFSIY